jgi:hypothetical protein
VQQNEAAVTWRKSRYCATNGCVEVAEDSGTYLVRDSKRPTEDPFLRFPRGTWSLFLDGIKAGVFDR